MVCLLCRDIDLNCTPAPFDLNCPFGEDPVVQDGTNELINEKTSEGQFAQATTGRVASYEVAIYFLSKKKVYHLLMMNNMVDKKNI